jgi:hypothetical protein
MNGGLEGGERGAKCQVSPPNREEILYKIKVKVKVSTRH